MIDTNAFEANKMQQTCESEMAVQQQDGASIAQTDQLADGSQQCERMNAFTGLHSCLTWSSKQCERRNAFTGLHSCFTC